MSKYDIAMDITPGNIPAMLMDHIPDDSDVLEFGCATGRMTRYMKEEKHCRVWIVEIEQDAYERASAFAYGGWRGDAEQLGWQEELGGLRFDCILFADVLEHLRDPQKVLRAAKEFLKENGTILISIPNIAHFDVLAKLAQNKFTYTDLGLLDSTHVHFWGEQDLEPFLEQAGLGITLLDGTCAAPCTTEQKLSRETVPPELFSALLRTPLHTVYQFLIAVQTKAWIQKVGIMPINRLRDESQCSAFYWDMGAGYHSDQVEIISAKSYGGQTTVVFQADLPDGCQRVRFDPVEESACMVCDLTTFVDGLRCEAIPLNGIQIGQSILFTNTDPQIEISLPKNSKKLTVKSTIYALQNKDWLSFFTSVFAERSASEQTHTQLQAEKAASERALIQIQTELDLSNHETEHVKTEHNRLATEKVMLEKEHSRLQSEKFTLEHALAQLKEKTVKLEGEHPHLQTEKSSLERAHAQLQMENPKLAEKCAHLRTEKSLLGQAHTQLQTKNAKLEGKYAHLRTEKSSLERAYTQLQTEKATLEAELARLQTDNESLMEQLKLSRQETQIWAARYSLISNSQCWKLTAPIRKVLDGIKRTQPGHLAYQGLRYWYANGFSATLRKVKAYRRRTPTIIQVSSPTQTSVDSFAGLAGKFSSDCGMRVICSKTLVSYDRSPLKTVLLISHELDLTGAPIAMLHLTDCLKNLGYLPVIISPHDGALSKELEQKGIPALLCPQIYSSEIIRQFAGLFDVIFANTIVSAPAVTALYGFSQPTIWWVHEAEASYFEATVAALPDDLPETVHVYAGGAYAKARLLSHRPSWQVRELLYYVPDFREQQEPFALPANAAGKTVFACIGMLEQRKGQDILAKAIEHLPETLLRHTYFIFVGRRCYEPNYRSIMELLKRYPDNVQYIEELSMADLRRLYRRMDCLICSSRDDPMPIVVTEAMLMAKLIICSENTGSAAILRADHSGFVYEKDDPELLCRCIQQVLAGGKALEPMRTAARQSYETHFSHIVFEENVRRALELAKTEQAAPSPSLSMSAFAKDFHDLAKSDDLFSAESQVLAYDEGPEQKRVLLVSHELSLTGAPIVLQYLAESFIRAGIQVVLASPADGPLRSQLEEKHIPTLVYTNLYYDDFLTRHAEAFDLIVLNTVVTFCCVERLCCSQTPILWWIHDSLASYEVGGFADIMPKSLPKHVKVACGGEYARGQLLKYYPSYRADVLYYTAPDDADVPVPTYEMHRDTAKLAFAVIGQQDFRKGHDIFASAIDLLTEEERRKAQFYFIGSHLDPQIQKAVDEICAKFPDCTFYIPQVNRRELLSVYRQCACIVCSSRDDPLPVFVTEAMMMSNIIICSEHTGSAPILQQQNAGLVYHNDNPTELAEQIRTVLSTTLEHFAPMRQRARQAYETYFSRNSFDKKVEELSCTLMHQRSKDEFKGTVSVVIPTYNASSSIEKLLKCLFSQVGIRKIEVLVVDSGSTDGTPVLCKENGARLIEIQQSEFSHSHARNLGAKNAVGDILLFMTQDALPQNEHWMRTLIEPIVSGEAAATSCREQCPEGTDLFYKIAVWRHGSFLGIRDRDKLNYMKSEDTPSSLRSKASLNDVTTAVNTAIFMRFHFRFNYAEDLDLGLRLLKAGYGIKLFNSTHSVHGHNRPAGYYLKRAYVEARGLERIQPGWGAVPQEQSVAARKVTYGARLLLSALEIFTRKKLGTCTVDLFITELQGTLTQALKYKELPEKPLFDDNLLQWCMDTVHPYSLNSCEGEADLFHHVCYYLDSIVSPYLLDVEKETLEPEMQQCICKCLIKQFSLAVGGALAGIPASAPLYAQIQLLTKGV